MYNEKTMVYTLENHEQITLFGEFGQETAEQNFLKLISHRYKESEAFKVLDKIDWDFKGFTTQYLTHKFHSYPARFIPQIPLSFIKLFTNEGNTICDPMCGCGTTLVEAFLNNRNSIGNDFNPLAVLISKVKTTLIPAAEFEYLERKIRDTKRYLDLDYWRIEHRANNLPNRTVSKIFNKTIIGKLEAIREMILELKEESCDDIYDFARVALSSTIWSLVENGNGLDVENSFIKKIQMMKKELLEMSKIVSSPPIVRVIHGDARNLQVESSSVDLIVTSPPYVNALDYYRAHMYNMLWLGMDFDIFRKHEIGGHSHFIMNRFRLLSEYLGDMLRTMIEMNRILKTGKICSIVVGNSSLEYELIESHKYFSSFANKIGFKHIKTFFRNIDKTRKYTSADIGQIDDEYIVVLKKVSDSKVDTNDEEFIAKEVKRQIETFREQIRKNPGSSIRGRRPSAERLSKNVERISEAIDTISEDIKIKE
jgi:DNA modification methylase